MSKRGVRRSAGAMLVTGAVLATGLALARPAAAAFDYVERLTYRDTVDSCLPGDPGCTPNAGNGQSNVLRILQVETDNGLAFGDFETTSLDSNRLWMAATIGAECKPLRRLARASITLGYDNDSGGVNEPTEVSPYDYYAPISVPRAKVMPNKTIALNIPVDLAFQNMWDFDSLADVYTYGEARIADRVAQGMNEATARSLPITFNTLVATSATVFCSNLSGNNETWRQRGRYLPLQIQYVPVPVPPVGRPPVDDLQAKARVTNVELAVQPDPFDACTLRLYGRIDTNRATTVKYHFVNPNGQKSNTYTLKVDASRTGYVSAVVAIPRADGSDPEGDLTTPGRPPFDLGDLVGDVDADGYSGTFLLRTTSPNRVTAGDGFRVPFCPPPVQGPDGEAG